MIVRYPITYLLAMFGFLSHSTTAVTFQLLSALSKGLYGLFAKVKKRLFRHPRTLLRLYSCSRILFEQDVYYQILADAENAIIDEKRAFEAGRAKEQSQYVFWTKIRDTDAVSSGGKSQRHEDQASYGAL